MLSVLAAGPSAWAAAVALPQDVPNVLDPNVQVDYQPYQVGNLEGNPDFPVILFMSRGREKPAAVVVAIDARNGRETWSITSDPIILVAVFSSPKQLSGLYLDHGFAQRGAPSGTLTPATEQDGGSLPDLLRTVAEARAQTYM
ncbi:MAG: hypothetical protein ACE147_15330 [Candidatus Methylomirabilales bacterium]